MEQAQEEGESKSMRDFRDQGLYITEHFSRSEILLLAAHQTPIFSGSVTSVTPQCYTSCDKSCNAQASKCNLPILALSNRKLGIRHDDFLNNCLSN